MLRLALRLAGKSHATLQTSDLAEAFPALGMRNGWKYVIANQPRAQGSLLSCAGKIGTPGQSDFRTNSYWLLKDKSVTTGSPHNPQHGRTSENTD